MYILYKLLCIILVAQDSFFYFIFIEETNAHKHRLPLKSLPPPPPPPRCVNKKKKGIWVEASYRKKCPPWVLYGCFSVCLCVFFYIFHFICLRQLVFLLVLLGEMGVGWVHVRILSYLRRLSEANQCMQFGLWP